MFALIGGIIGLIVVAIYLILRAFLGWGYRSIDQEQKSKTHPSKQGRIVSAPPPKKDYTKIRIGLIIAILMIVVPIILLILYAIVGVG